MKMRTIIVIAMVALLLVGSVALAQSGGPPSLGGYIVKQVAIAGGGYRLASITWQAQGLAGGGYRLVPSLPAGTGTPCCCTYLPCVLRQPP